ncbi:acyl-CoA dehydrogenase family protein [Henriciella aquimarina]|uniref:acyl-CoA dehydrogenase family protein n=1 Tax=Henriciella aquimarina TaxID=545261 RepID=UPI000A009B5B|nr:acyl-CoA dehydrogenase family protein [Henriciella aquimarina]
MASTTQTEAPSDTAAASNPSQQELVERARRLARVAEERAETTERARRVPDETVAAMFEADLLRLVQPVQWGGMGRRPRDYNEIIYELARGCGSTGWVYCVLAGHSDHLSHYPEEAIADVWGEDRTVLLSSAFAPTLKAKKVEGGYQVKGDAPFSSGCDHGQWALLGGLVFGEDGPPLHQIFLIPRTNYEIVDDWFTLGLGGTGSKTLHIEGTFVPDHRAIDLPDALAIGSPVFGLQSAMLGTARGGIDSFIRTIRNKPGKAGGPPPAQSDLFQSAIGQSLSEVTYAWEIVQKVTAENEPLEEQKIPYPADQIIRNRGAIALVSKMCLSAVERVFELSGGSGVFDNRLSRALRDVRTAANHVALNAMSASKTTGELVLAQPD